MGANITYRCVGPNQYIVTLKFYRDCDGISPASSHTLDYSSATCGVSSAITLNQVGSGVDISPICPTGTSSCGGSGPFGIEEYTYEGTLNLPPGCGNDWVLGWSVCCRNAAITTLNSPDTQDIYVSALLDNTNSPCNSSPTFTNPPIAVICLNEPVIFNHGATDVDGDSLSYSLVNCNQGPSTTVGYGGGYSGANPLTAAPPVSIDPVTGVMSFTPTAIQVGVICIRVEEWRGGVKIGEIIRDMQFNVIACSNNSPTLTGINGTGVYDTTICVGMSTCFDIFGADADVGDLLTVNWNAGIATGLFTITGDGTSSPSATFCWTPTSSDVGTNYFTVTITDDNCPLVGSNTYTYAVTVIGTANTINAGPDVSICAGNTTVLNATSSGATGYVWTPGTGLSSTVVSNPTAGPVVTTNYTVTGTFADGCALSDNVTVVVNPLPSVSVTPPISYTCPGGGGVLLTASAPTATGYQWYEVGVGAIGGATGSTYNATPGSTAQYAVEVTDGNGCVAYDTVTVNVAVPDSTTCNVVYVNTTGGGDGTRANPTDLVTALGMAACNSTVIKMATGTYTYNNAITAVTSNVTIEGGFIEASGWQKISTPGATTIQRSTSNVEDAAGAGPRLTAFYINSQTGFRFQDVTVEVLAAPANSGGNRGISTYGVHMTNCSNYNFTRTQVIAGDGGVGDNGANNTTIAATGENGQAGTPGDEDDQDRNRHGGYGGAGGGVGGGGRGDDAFGRGCTMGGAISDAFGGCTGCSVGCNGYIGGDGANYWNGGGGGGGGGGGQEARDGGRGGWGGGVNAGGSPPFMCSVVMVSNTVPGSDGAGACRDAGDWWGNESDCNGSVSLASAESGRCGNDGTDGCDGIAGAAGSAGAHAGGFWNPGGQGSQGSRGWGGQGGSGGGGGAGEGTGGCIDGTGSSGGGGGGGGEGGYGGFGGWGGGGSFPLYLVNSNVGANIVDCNLQNGVAGAGGAGGSGSNGGNGGNGGTEALEGSGDVGDGGRGGAGGDGGNGGAGGAGSTGTTTALYDNTSTVAYTPFNLAAQQVITMDNIGCTNTNINFSGPLALDWNFPVDATPVFVPFNPLATTQFSTTGRKDINYGADQYTGFAHIIIPDTLVPDIGTSAPLVMGEYRICAGDSVDFVVNNPGFGYIYHWDMDGGSIPNNYDGTSFDVLNDIVFNTADTFYIQLRFETDCCGNSPTDTLMLIVEPNPTIAVAGDTDFCLGDSTTLTASGGDHYLWSPSTGLSSTTTATVVAKPTVTTTYTVTAFNANETCYDVTTVTVTVNDIDLTATPTHVSCGTNGEALVNVTGGSGSYIYAWNDPLSQTTNPATTLGTGTYQVVVTDVVTGCMDSIGVYVDTTAGAILSYVSALTPVQCNGGSDGVATVSLLGGVGPFAYNWAPAGGTGATSTPLSAGTYTVTILDFGNPACSDTLTVNIPEPTVLDLALVDTVSTTCINSTDGEAHVNASGGAGGFIYSWYSGPTTGPSIGSGPSLVGVMAGTYRALVTDANGCVDSIDVTIVNIHPCVLPVEYLSFEATAMETFIQLDWETLGEENNNGFEIERSTNTTDYDRIGWVESTSTGSGAKYQFDDVEVVPEQKYFYRLKQIDFDGNYAYSEVRSAILHVSDQIYIIKVYPNPADDRVNVDLYLNKDADLSIQIVNAVGQHVTTIEGSYTQGNQTVGIDVSGLSSGMYFVKVYTDSKAVGVAKLNVRR